MEFLLSGTIRQCPGSIYFSLLGPCLVSNYPQNLTIVGSLVRLSPSIDKVMVQRGNIAPHTHMHTHIHTHTHTFFVNSSLLTYEGQWRS